MEETEPPAYEEPLAEESALETDQNPAPEDSPTTEAEE
jgi:hypothetical protein